MKPVVVTIVCILILALLSGVIFYKFAHDEIHKTTLKKQRSLGLGTLFNGLMIDAVICFVVIWLIWKPLSLIKSWAFRIAVGVGVLGFLVALYVVVSRGMASYANVPLSWSGLSLLACSFGAGSAAFFKRA